MDTRSNGKSISTTDNTETAPTPVWQLHPRSARVFMLSARGWLLLFLFSVAVLFLLLLGTGTIANWMDSLIPILLVVFVLLGVGAFFINRLSISNAQDNRDRAEQEKEESYGYHHY